MTVTPVRRNGVNPALTPDPRTERVVDHDAYAAFARRIVRSYATRVASGDVEALPGLIGLADEINHAIAQAVTGLRGFGYSWAEIAARVGVTRQAAQQRWGGEQP